MAATSRKEVTKVQAILAQMQKNLECAICLEMMSNPISTNCGHQFCRFCIMEFLERKKQVPCPLCKKTITKRSLTEREQLGGMVDSIRQLISAFQMDTGELFTPPRGSQAHVIPATQELLSREPDKSTETNKGNKGKNRGDLESGDTAGLDTDELLRCITEGLHGAEDTDTETPDPEPMDVDHSGDASDKHTENVDIIDNDSKSKLLLEMIENGSHGALRSTDEETSETQETAECDTTSASQEISQSVSSVDRSTGKKGKSRDTVDCEIALVSRESSQSASGVEINPNNTENGLKVKGYDQVKTDNEPIVLSGNSEAKRSDIDASENSSGMGYSLFRTPLDPKAGKKGKTKETISNRTRRSTRTKSTGKTVHDSEDVADSKPEKSIVEHVSSTSCLKQLVDETSSDIGVSFLDEKKIQYTYNRKATDNKSKDMAGKKKVEEWLKHIPQKPETETNKQEQINDKNVVRQSKRSMKKAQRLLQEEDLMGKRIKHLSEIVQETNKELLFHGESFMNSPKTQSDRSSVSHGNIVCEPKDLENVHTDQDNVTEESDPSKDKECTELSDRKAKSFKLNKDENSKSNIVELETEVATETAIQKNLYDHGKTSGIELGNKSETMISVSTNSCLNTTSNDENAKPSVPQQKKRIFKSRAPTSVKQINQDKNVNVKVTEKVNSDKEGIVIVNISKPSDQTVTNNMSNTSKDNKTSNLNDNSVDPFEFVSSQNTPVKPVKGKKNAKSKAKATKTKKLPLKVQKQNNVKSKVINKGIGTNHVKEINSKYFQTASQIEIDRVSVNLDQANDYEFLTSTQDAMKEFATGEISSKGGKKKKVSFREPELCEFIYKGKVDVAGYRKAKAEVAAVASENKQVDNIIEDKEQAKDIEGPEEKACILNEEGKENQKPNMKDNDVDKTAESSDDDDVSEDWKFQDDNSSGTDDLDIEPTVEEYEQPDIEIQTEEMKAMLSQEMFETHVLQKSPVVTEQQSQDPSIIAETPQLFAVPIFTNKLKLKTAKSARKANLNQGEISTTGVMLAPETTVTQGHTDQVSENVKKNMQVNVSSKTKNLRKKGVKRKKADSGESFDDNINKETLTTVPETPLIMHDSVEEESIDENIEIVEYRESTVNHSDMRLSENVSINKGESKSSLAETSQTSEETQAPSGESGELGDKENMVNDEETCVNTISDSDNVICSTGSQLDESQTCEVTDSNTQDSESLLMPKPKRKNSQKEEKSNKSSTKRGSRKRKRKCFDLDDDNVSNEIDRIDHNPENDNSGSNDKEAITNTSKSTDSRIAGTDTEIEDIQDNRIPGTVTEKDIIKDSQSARIGDSQVSVISVRSDSQISEKQMDMDAHVTDVEACLSTNTDKDKVVVLESQDRVDTATAAHSVTIIPDSVVDDVSQVPDSRIETMAESMEDSCGDNSAISTRRLSTLLSSVDQILEETKSSQEMKKMPKALQECQRAKSSLADKEAKQKISQEKQKIPSSLENKRTRKSSQNSSQEILSGKRTSQRKTRNRKQSQDKERQRNVSGILESPEVSQFGSPENIFAADSEMPVLESSPMNETLQPVQLSDEEDVDISKHDETIDNKDAARDRQESVEIDNCNNVGDGKESVDKQSKRLGDSASLDVIPQTCSQNSDKSQENKKLEHVKRFSTPSPSTKRKSIKTARGFSKKLRHSASPLVDSDSEASPLSKPPSTPKHLLNRSLTSSPAAKYKSPKLASTHTLPLIGQSPISGNDSHLLTTPVGKRRHGSSSSTPVKTLHITPSKYSPSISKQKIEKASNLRSSFAPEVVDMKPEESIDNEEVVENVDDDKDSIIDTPTDLPDLDGGTLSMPPSKTGRSFKTCLPSSSESETVKKRKVPKRSPKLILEKDHEQSDPATEENTPDIREKISKINKYRNKSDKGVNNRHGSDINDCELADSYGIDIDRNEKRLDGEDVDTKHLNNSENSNSSSDLNLDSLIEEENSKDNCAKNSSVVKKNKDEDGVPSSPDFTLDSSGEEVKEQAMKVIEKFNEIKDITKDIDNDSDDTELNKFNKVSKRKNHKLSYDDPETANDKIVCKKNENDKNSKSPKVINSYDNMYSTNLDSSPEQPEVILESDIESEEEKETTELADDDSDSEEDEIVRRKHVKKAVIDSSSEDDDDNSRQMNLTSSSAFSSQSENLTTQDRLSLEKELERMEREMKNVKEQLKKNRKSNSPQKDDSESDMIEADDTGDEMDDVMFVSLPPPPSPPASQEVTGRGDNSQSQDSKGDHSAGPEDTQHGNCEILLGGDGDHAEPEGNISESQMETVPPSLSDQLDEDTIRPALVDLDTNIDRSTSKLGQKRQLGFVATGLSVPQIQEVKKLAALNDAKFYNRFNRAVTHVIVKPDAADDLLCDRTLKFFQGVAHKCWVVNHFWVVDSRQVGHILPESGYEIQGDTATSEAHQGPKLSRLSSKQLFTGMQFSLIGDNAYLSKDSMRELIETCGGHVGDVEDLDPSTGTAFVICCTDIEEEGETSTQGNQIQSQSRNFYRMYQVLTLTREWVLDSITLYKLQGLHEYVVTNVKHTKIPQLSQP